MTTRPVILHADARALPLPGSSVDLIVTSPPYFGLRDYQDGAGSLAGQVGAEETPKAYIAALLECTAEWMRVLKPGGSMFVVLGDAYSAYNNNRGPSRSLSVSADPGRGRVARPGLLDHVRNKSLYGLPWRYALGCIDELGLILRDEIIWSKPNPMPTSAKDRTRRGHEQVFHFVRQPRYYARVDGIREPHTMRPQRWPKGRPRDETPRHGQPKQAWPTASRDEPGFDGHPLGKLPGSVWVIRTQSLKVPTSIGLRRHYAVFPLELPRRCIEGWAPPGGVVLDPFGGTGTTSVMAAAMGRTGVTADLSWDYCKVTSWRSTNPREMAKALRTAESLAA